jgi:phage terminase Nu1 subunit (DNA packaging protein)
MLSAETISKYTGIPEKTIYNWKKNGIVPESDDLTIIIRAIIAHLKGEIEGLRDKNKGKDSLYEEKTRLTKAQADKVELENAVTEGELMLAAEVGKTWGNVITACKSRLLAIPIKLAHEVSVLDDPIQIQEIIESEIYEALIELSNNIEMGKPTET